MHMYIVNSMKKTDYIRHFPCGMQCPNINPCIPLVRLASILPQLLYGIPVTVLLTNKITNQ